MNGVKRLYGQLVASATGLQRFLIQGVKLEGPVVYSTLQTLTFGATIAINCDSGLTCSFNASSNAAHALGAPTNAAAGMILTVTERNTSGGAIATMTFNVVYKLGAAWTAPANGTSRTVQFRFDGTNWVEINRTAADVAN